MKHDELKKASRLEVHPENCVGCMLCQMRCSLAYLRIINPLRSRIVIQSPVTGGPGIRLTEECNHCGLCARVCAYGALEWRDK